MEFFESEFVGAFRTLPNRKNKIIDKLRKSVYLMFARKKSSTKHAKELAYTSFSQKTGRSNVNTREQARIWTTKTYDRLAKYYDTFMRLLFPLGERGRERIAARLDSGTVLDVACGTGTLLALAFKKGLKCYGLDLSKGMLEQTRLKVPAAEIERASYYAMPFSDNCFDYVVATNALSSGSIDAASVLTEMVRVCKRNGEIYIAEWQKAAVDTFAERLMDGIARFNEDAPKDYLRIFNQLGYEPEVETIDKRLHVFGIKK